MTMRKEEYINVNLSSLFSEDKKYLTQRGWLKSSELEDGDRIIAVSGESAWKEIEKKKIHKHIQTGQFFG